MEVRSIETIVKALNDAAVQYLVVGGLAVNAHGYERLTVDVDLVVGLQPENIVRAIRTPAGDWLSDGDSGRSRGFCQPGDPRDLAQG